MYILNMEAVKESLHDWINRPLSDHPNQQVALMQVVVFVMCGGGLLGRFASEQPADFYIDDRVGRLPFGKKEILQAVKVLELAAIEAGFDPRKMPEAPRFHNMGVF
jgi:hypothetical protein